MPIWLPKNPLPIRSGLSTVGSGRKFTNIRKGSLCFCGPYEQYKASKKQKGVLNLEA